MIKHISLDSYVSIPNGFHRSSTTYCPTYICQQVSHVARRSFVLRSKKKKKKIINNGLRRRSIYYRSTIFFLFIFFYYYSSTQLSVLKSTYTWKGRSDRLAPCARALRMYYYYYYTRICGTPITTLYCFVIQWKHSAAEVLFKYKT